MFHIETIAFPTYKDRFIRYLHAQKDFFPVAGKLLEHGIITREKAVHVARCTDPKEGETSLLHATFESVDNEKLNSIALFLKPYSENKLSTPREGIKEDCGEYCIMRLL